MTDDSPPSDLSATTTAPVVDARALLRRGIDPFSTVMAAADDIASGGLLIVEAPFNPTPLRRVMAGRGFSSLGRKLAEGHWRVEFRLDGAEGWQDRTEADILPEGAMTWREEDGVHVDVRRLQPPEPLRAILRLVETMDGGGGLIVHHDRDPVFLAPELAERGWRIVNRRDQTAEITLWLEPAP